MQAPSSSTEAAVPRVESRISGQTLVVFGFLLLVPLLFWPSTVILFEEWTDFENLGESHGFLIVAVTAWLLWGERPWIAAAPIRPSALGFAALILCCLVWLILLRAALRDPHVILLPAILLSAVLAVFGWQLTRVLLFPLAFLAFAMPVAEILTGTLQTISVRAVELLIWLTGLPATVDGHIVTVPSGRFAIEGGCSGVHFFIVGLATAALYGEINRASLNVRLALLALMAALALICNWIRIFTIIVAGHLTEMQHWLITTDHYWFGWGLFVLVVVLYMWIVRKWPTGEEPTPPVATAKNTVRPGALVAGIAILAAAPLTAYVLEARERVIGPFSLSLPEGRNNWSGPDLLIAGDWRPVFHGAHGAAHVAYRRASGDALEVAAFVYGAQRQNVELVTGVNTVVGEGQTVVASGSTATSEGVVFAETEIVGDDEHRSVVWSLYLIGDSPVLNPRKAQLLYGVRSIAGAPSSAALAMRAPCVPDCEAARKSLHDFAGSLGPSVLASLQAPAGNELPEARP